MGWTSRMGRDVWEGRRAWREGWQRCGGGMERLSRAAPAWRAPHSPDSLRAARLLQQQQFGGMREVVRLSPRASRVPPRAPRSSPRWPQRLVLAVLTLRFRPLIGDVAARSSVQRRQRRRQRRRRRRRRLPAADGATQHALQLAHAVARVSAPRTSWAGDCRRPQCADQYAPLRPAAPRSQSATGGAGAAAWRGGAAAWRGTAVRRPAGSARPADTGIGERPTD